MATALAIKPRLYEIQLAPRRVYHPELDCLRFFAFFGVFIFHTFPPDVPYYTSRHIPFPDLWASFARAGSFGVDLFFLLSAFLITELLLREKDESGAVHLRRFYLRRMLRIWPLYLVGIAVGCLLPLVYTDQIFPSRYALAFLLFYGNWLISFTGFPQSVANPLWSVSFEEQFYLLWPIVVGRVRQKCSLLVIGAFMTLTSMAARLILLRYGRHSETAIFTNTVARLDPLAYGIVTAVLFQDNKLRLTGIARVGLAVAGASIWLFAGHTFGLNYVSAVVGYPAMALGAWLIFMAAFRLNFAPVWLRYLGKVSYGLYVFHLLALYLTTKILGGYAHNVQSFVLYWIVGLGMTICLAAASYRFLETPFLRIKERLAFVKSRPV